MKLKLDTKQIESALSVLTDAQAGSLFKAIINYSLCKRVYIDSSVESVFNVLKDDIETCNERSARYKSNIMKRWHREETIVDEVVVIEEPEIITTETIDETTDEKKRFVKPSQEEVVEYFFNHLNATDNVEAVKFYAYYESNGWKVGKNKMKKWHSAASGWWMRNNKDTYGTTRKHTTAQQQAEQLAAGCAVRVAAENSDPNYGVPPLLRK